MQQQPRQNLSSDSELPLIPDKLYFSIGEVARLCQVKAHVLRYWEQEFLQLSPVKRRGNRRYYQRKDVLLVRKIKDLLYVQGFTIEGARAQLLQIPESPDENISSADLLQNTLQELEKLLLDLEAEAK